MHAAPTAVLGTSAHGDSIDPLARFTKHKRYTSPIATHLMTDAELRQVGRDIANCADRLLVDLPLDEAGTMEPLLRAANLCNRRLCPFCEWRRTRALRTRVIRGLDAFSAVHPKHRGLFLTLTVRNCPLPDLRQTISDMHRSLVRMTKCSFWPTDFWLRRTEVTVKRIGVNSQASGAPAMTEMASSCGDGAIQSVHPHLHLLLLVKPSYFSHGYVKQLEWQRQWQMAARLDYAPVVDVRVAKTRANDDQLVGVAPVSAVMEAAKYATKATDLIGLGSEIAAFHWQVKGLRFFATSKPLGGFIRDADPLGDELLDTDQFPVPVLTPALSVLAQWFADSQEYRFIS